MAEMKFSTGNQIQGKIMEIRKGAVTAIVYVAVAGDVTLEASVTIASLETLKLYEGYYHDLLNDAGKETVMADILGWIAARLA